MCQGEITGGVIGGNNMVTILSYFGSNAVVGQADIKNNGVVRVIDMFIFISLF